MSETITPHAANEVRTTSIWDSAVCLCLIQCLPAMNRKLGDDEYEVDADKEFTSANKKILKCQEFDAIGRLDRTFKAWLRLKALPTDLLRSAMFPVSLPMVVEVDEALEHYKAKRAEAVEAFLVVYPERIEEQMAVLRSTFNDADYPTPEDMRDAFDVRSHWVTFETPASLKKIKSSMFEQERKKMSNAMEVASKKMEQAMAVALQELTGHLARSLTAKDDGKKRILRKSAIIKVQDFLSTFRDRNITNDDELLEQVEKAEAILDGVDSDRIRKSVLLEQSVRGTMGEIATSLNGLIEERGRRIILD